MGGDDGAGRDRARAVFGNRLATAREALARRCPADALAALDDIGTEAEVWHLKAKAWHQVGSARGLMRLGAPPGASGDDKMTTTPFAEGPLELGFSPDNLAEALAAAARDGRAGEAARLHLVAADQATRVDLRFGHVEAAAALAEVLEDPRLTLLVEAFEARLDADVGDDADALTRIDAVLAEATADANPNAWRLALAVRFELLGRAGDAPPEAMTAARDAARRAGPWPGARWGIGDPP